MCLEADAGDLVDLLLRALLVIALLLEARLLDGHFVARRDLGAVEVVKRDFDTC